MTIDLKWLIGNRVKDIGKQDYSWFFDFDGGGTITQNPLGDLSQLKVLKPQRRITATNLDC